MHEVYLSQNSGEVNTVYIQGVNVYICNYIHIVQINSIYKHTCVYNHRMDG